MFDLTNSESESFKGYLSNTKPVIFGFLNPLLIVPVMLTFLFHWTPLQIVMCLLFVGTIVLDITNIRASEAFREVKQRWIKRNRITKCATTHTNRYRQLKKMGFINEDY